MKQEKFVYVISDLHLGGCRFIKEAGRGFQIFSHADLLAEFINNLALDDSGNKIELVINGDFIDFLTDEPIEGRGWSAFVSDQQKAICALDRVIENNKIVFNALRSLLSNGKSLTLIIGNHDIELSLPKVRNYLFDYLDESKSSKLTFFYDGEAYIVGDALIEHGNDYDRFNRVDHDKLRKYRSLISRNPSLKESCDFVPPLGSMLVAEVINKIKIEFPFVDLLKPETSAVIPIILAIAPQYKKEIFKILRLNIGRGTKFKTEYEGVDISSAQKNKNQFQFIKKHLLDNVDESVANELIELLEIEYKYEPVSGTPISSKTTRQARSLLGNFALLLNREKSITDDKLKLLNLALSILQDDKSFNSSIEEDKYLNPAKKMFNKSINHVIFGHTHLAKHICVEGNKTYTNSGTWGDLMKFPEELCSLDGEYSSKGLRCFVDKLVNSTIKELVFSNPTFVRLKLEGASSFDTVTEIDLCTYKGGQVER